MATIRENIHCWDVFYNWRNRGEGWSYPWGNSRAQWSMSLLSRIQRFLPTGTVLKMGLGFGRWGHYLRAYFRSLIGVDISSECIDACRERFAADPQLSFHVNNGASLDMVPDGSIDFIFSFDSLVDAEADTLWASVREWSKKLTPDGVGFVHHSNSRKFKNYFALTRPLNPRGGGGLLRQLGLLQTRNGRALSMDNELFRAYYAESGLACIRQKWHNWRGTYLIDYISIFTRPGSRWHSPYERIFNHRFMKEAKIIKRLARHYFSNLPGSVPAEGTQ